MKIIIVGCGKVGSTLAASLAAEKHNIIVIDKISEKVNQLTSSVDCMGVVGNGAIQSVLIEAEIETADFLIACTSSDEINILTCLIARKSSKCRTIARIRNPEYSKQISYIMNELDISMTINPELAAANEITRIIRYSSSISSDSFFKGGLNLLKVEIPDNSKIIGIQLNEISKKMNCNVLICAVDRDNNVFVPSGTTDIKKDDKVYFVADHNNAFSFFKAIGYPYRQLNSFMIIGAGRITNYLINNLTNNNPNCKIKVIEKERSICDDLVSEYQNISVVCADATDKNMLEKEGLYDVDAFITLTGIDEENILLSLFAKQNEKTKIITKINHLNFINSLKEIDVGSVVNPEKVASNIIVSYIRAFKNVEKSNIETLYKLSNEKIEALGFRIKNDSKIINIKFKDMKIKKNILIAGIYRHGKVIIPNGNEAFEIGDSVVVVSSNKETLYNIEDILL